MLKYTANCDFLRSSAITRRPLNFQNYPHLSWLHRVVHNFPVKLDTFRIKLYVFKTRMDTLSQLLEGFNIKMNIFQIKTNVFQIKLDSETFRIIFRSRKI